MGIAQSAADLLGLHGDLEHLRSSANELFRVGDAVLRVGPSELDVEAQLALIDYLAAAGIPVLRPRAEPVVVDNILVTVWDYVDHEQPIDYEQLGHAIARLHTLDPSHVAELVPVAPCHDAAWLDLSTNLDIAARSAVVTTEDIDILRRAVQDVGGWEDRALEVSQVVCHADVHPLNVLMREESLVILDWDSICTGPRAWDHAALLTWAECWGGDPATYTTFAGAYGVDLTADPLAQTLAQVRLLAPTINMIVKGATSEAHATEARKRMRHWRGEPDAPPWTPH